jgi:hypothetical protein
LIPVGDYPTAIVTTVDNPDAGADCFGGPMPLDGSDHPLWTESLFAFPEELSGRWTRLRFHFSSDRLYRDIGWLIADMDLVPADNIDSFRPRWSPQSTEISWLWPDREITAYSIEKLGEDSAWRSVWSDTPQITPGARLALNQAFLALDEPQAGERIALRVSAMTPFGRMISPEVVLVQDYLVSSGLRLDAQIGSAVANDLRLPLFVDSRHDNARLGVYNLRGQLLRDWRIPTGRTLHLWDGRDANGRTIPSGLIIYRLATDRATITRKAVILR